MKDSDRLSNFETEMINNVNTISISDHDVTTTVLFCSSRYAPYWAWADPEASDRLEVVVKEVIASATVNPLSCPNSYLSELQLAAAEPEFY